MLQISQISFERGDRQLFHGLEFNLKAGECLQIVGPNGSGKTTLLQILCGFATPTTGEICWQGKPIQQQLHAYQTSLHYIGHGGGIKQGLTVKENLRLSMALAPTRYSYTLEEAIAKVGLKNSADSLACFLSAGQQRRVLCAKLLLLQQPLWLLDEPFAALDHAGISLLESLLDDHLQQGGTVVLSSHQPFTLGHNVCQQLTLTEHYA